MKTNQEPKKSMPEETSFSVSEIAQILEMLERHGVTQFSLCRGGAKLALRRGSPIVFSPTQGALPSSPIPLTQPATGAEGAPLRVLPGGASAIAERVSGAEAMLPADRTGSPAGTSKKQLEVVSPMVGTFYRRPAVDAEAYVQVGDTVKKGDVLCIVEAMKLMNEIESTVSGRVVEICVEDAELVEYGEVLFRIEPV